MSSGGGAIAAAPRPIGSPPKALPPQPIPGPPRRKPVTENWDDDFEFSIPVKAKTAPAPSRSPVSTPKREPSSFLGEGRLNGLSNDSKPESPDSFDEDWDEPLTGPSRSGSTLSATRVGPPQRSPAGASPSRLHPPRSSQSHSPTLPTPSPTTPSATTWKTTVGFPSQPAASSTSPIGSRAGDSSAARPGLSKRSSTSFVTVRQGDVSPLSSHKSSPAARSSPVLPDKPTLHSSSSSSNLRRVPVPPLTKQDADLGHGPSPTRRHSPTKSIPSSFTSPSKSLPGKSFPSPFKGSPSSFGYSSPSPAKSNPPSQNASPSGLPPPDSVRPKRPSFWKRFSSGPSPSSSKEPSPEKSPGRRKRASSVGAGLAPASSDEPVPPLPPLPANLRSPSGTSTMSSPSRLPSNTSVHSNNSKGKRMMAPFMMRRSSSNVSYAVESPSKPGTVRATGMLASAGRSSSSVNIQSLCAAASASASSHTPPLSSAERFSTSPLGHASQIASEEAATSASTSRPTSSRPRAFSPGFHLPSPSPGSPYSQISSPGNVQSDSEMDDGQPKSRQRVRPASAMPIPRKREQTITLSPQGSESMHSLSSTAGTSAPRNVHMPTLEALSKGSSSSRQASSTSQQQSNEGPGSPARSFASSHSQMSSSQHSHNGFAAQTQSTLRRLTSFSKKHRRRLSGGWKFGTGSSQSSSNETRPKSSQHLETVEGSPSKPIPFDHQPPGSSPLPTSAFPGDSGLDLGSPPRSNSRRLHQPSSTSLQVLPHHHVSDPPDWDETTRSRGTRERRRLSFNDFVIPDQVLAKQKELKRGIGAVKKFAGGVQSLKALVAAHDTVCDNVLAAGTQDDMKLFVSLENEYTQWWEMATVLIEVGSTGTEDSSASAAPLAPNPVRTRRITLATDDARAAGEALSSISSRGGSYATVKSIYSDMQGDVFGDLTIAHSDPPSHDPKRASTGKHDLSQRQLEMLRTMLRTPVSASDSVVATVDQRQALKARMRQSMPVAPTNVREVLPSGPATVRATNGPLKTTPVNAIATLPIISPEPTYVVPSPSYPSPETAAQLAQPKNKGGLAGLKDFLRSLRASSSNKSSKSSVSSNETPKAARPTSQQQQQQTRRRPAPINTNAAEKYGHSPPPSPLPSAGSHEPMIYTTRDSELGSYKAQIKLENKKRRPSLKTIFRPSSGNWHELVRPTPPGSPLPTIPSMGTPDDPRTAADGSSITSVASSVTTPSRPRAGTLVRPPSIPAFARLKLTKPYGSTSGSGSGSDTPVGSPVKARHRGSVGHSDAPVPVPPLLTPPIITSPRPSSPKHPSAGAVPPVPPLPGSTTSTPPDGEATLRLKSRVLGLGHPSESSPSRASSSPASRVPNELQVPDEMPRSRSDGGMRDADDPIIALTPENLPVLLDYVKQCEKKLMEWRARAVSLELREANGGGGGAAGAGTGADAPGPAAVGAAGAGGRTIGRGRRGTAGAGTAAAAGSGAAVVTGT